MLQYLQFIPYLLCGIILSVNLSYASTAATPPKELVFLTWSEYIDPEIVTEFEKTHNAKIRFIYYQSDDNRDQIVLDANGKGFDIVILNGLKVATYAKRGWLEPLNTEKIPHLKFTNPKWHSWFESTQTYTSPYLWGTIGIAYRADLVSEPITRWIQLYQPQESLRNKIVMIDSQREVIGLALKALGYSMNSTNINEIKEAEILLNNQKPFVYAYSYMSVSESSSLVTGDAHAALAYNGDALFVMEHEKNIQFVLPEEGSNIWVDYLAVFKSAQNKKLAYQFLDFLQQPRIATKLALYTNYATTNVKAHELLPQEFTNNLAIYPNQETLSKSEPDKNLPTRILKEYARIMNNLTEN